MNTLDLYLSSLQIERLIKKHNEEEKEFHYASDAMRYVINILKEEGIIKE